MKSDGDHYTRDMLGNKPGRPRKPNAKTGAQRQREYRRRKAAQVFVAGDKNEQCSWCGAERSDRCGLCNIGQLGHKG